MYITIANVIMWIVYIVALIIPFFKLKRYPDELKQFLITRVVFALHDDKFKRDFENEPIATSLTFAFMYVGYMFVAFLLSLTISIFWAPLLLVLILQSVIYYKLKNKNEKS